jgi:hypothetical protein
VSRRVRSVTSLSTSNSARSITAGSVFWSSSKVREARVRQTVKQRGEKELQSQKAERAELKKANKL